MDIDKKNTDTRTIPKTNLKLTEKGENSLFYAFLISGLRLLRRTEPGKTFTKRGKFQPPLPINGTLTPPHGCYSNLGISPNVTPAFADPSHRMELSEYPPVPSSLYNHHHNINNIQPTMNLNAHRLITSKGNDDPQW